MYKEYQSTMVKISTIVNSDTKGVTINDGEKTVDIPDDVWELLIKDFKNHEDRKRT